MALSKRHTSAEFNFFLYIEDRRGAILKRKHFFFKFADLQATSYHFVLPEEPVYRQ